MHYGKINSDWIFFNGRLSIDVNGIWGILPNLCSWTRKKNLGLSLSPLTIFPQIQHLHIYTNAIWLIYDVIRIDMIWHWRLLIIAPNFSNCVPWPIQLVSFSWHLRDIARFLEVLCSAVYSINRKSALIHFWGQISSFAALDSCLLLCMSGVRLCVRVCSQVLLLIVEVKYYSWLDTIRISALGW